MSDSRDQRRAAAIHAYVGPNGSGKSLAMVHDTLPSLQQGRRVLSTVKLLGCHGHAHPLYEQLTDWHQLLDFRGGDVLLDEVQGVVSSRGHQSLPPAILNLLLQLRRRDVLLRWTAPSYARADLVLREVTQAVTYCRGMFPEKVRPCADDCDDPHHQPSCWFSETGELAVEPICKLVQHPHNGARLWASNRLFYFRTYDALAFDEFDAGKRERLKSMYRQWHWRPRHPAHRAYDTFDQVSHISDATEGGSCIRCGGTRRRPKCACDPDGGGEHGRRQPAAHSPDVPDATRDADAESATKSGTPEEAGVPSTVNV